MNSNQMPTYKFTDAIFYDASCITIPVLEAVLDQTLFQIMDYIAPTAQFRVSFLVDLEKMTGIGIVEREHTHALAAVHNDPRPFKVAGKPVIYMGEDIPTQLAVFMMIVRNAPEIFANNDRYFTFDVKARDKQ